jgi:hypothetical protein
MINKLIIIFLFLSLNLIVFSQHIPYKYHAEKGRFEIDYTYRKTFNPETNRYDFIKHCRRLIWSKREHTGDVYYYDNEKQTWIIKQETGVFWYCYWSSWSRC